LILIYFDNQVQAHNMLHLIFILLSIVSVLGFVPNESCFLNAKLDICAKFYPSAIKDCVKRMKPTYDKVNNNSFTIISINIFTLI